MKLNHITDFYYLEALKKESEKHTDTVKWVKIAEKVDELRDELIPKLAEAMFAYLFLACMGEARHACSGLAEKRYSPDLMPHGDSVTRDVIYELAPAYDPQSCIPKLRTLFNQGWGGSFGGRKWRDIADGIALFYKVPNAAFIDHCVDLQHNGGTAFSKSEASAVIKWSNSFSGTLSCFLDAKKSCNLMTYMETIAYVTSPVMKLLSMAGHPAIEANAIRLLPTEKQNEWTWESVDWGSKTITVVRKITDWRNITKDGNNWTKELVLKQLGPYEVSHYVFTKLVNKTNYPMAVEAIEAKFEKLIVKVQKEAKDLEINQDGLDLYIKAAIKYKKAMLRQMKKEVMPSKAKSKSASSKAKTVVISVSS